ncbi:MAG: cytoplasmic iron level regulating protein YaaA (DUF328/UPF0246 family) [Flavobacteriales bacterium]|jgi:cytoplasmic iron level regulating protein YaaA (DUF328/UPF0246 family)
MHILLSPAKTLNMDAIPSDHKISEFPFGKEATLLIKDLKKLKSIEVQSLMNVSATIAELNTDRFNKWSLPFSLENAKPAIHAFKGDVYTGMDASSLTEDELNFAQESLSILSGLYGLLRPFDLMQAYRLEMGTKFATKREKNLYEFWGDKITEEINTREKDTLLNLASNEYFKAVNKKTLRANLITPVFKDEKKGVLKVISFFAKKARGMMARYIIQNHITNVDEIKNFNLGGYAFNQSLSTDKEWVFTR